MGNEKELQKARIIDLGIRRDYKIILAVIFIATYGMIILFTSNRDLSELKRQLMFAFLGMVGMIIMSHLDYKLLKKIPLSIYYILSVLAMSLLLIPGLKEESKGATRWVVVFGVSIQIAEIVKFLMIIWLAYILSKHLRIFADWKRVLVIWIAAGFMGAMLLFISSNLSSCLVLLMITYCMTFMASSEKKAHLITLGAAILGVVGYCLYWLNNLPTLEELENIKSYQVVRIIAWLDPERYEKVAYQSLQGLYTIGSAGFFGKGLGNGTQRTFLPEASNDMIFDILIEELGIFGALVLMLLFIYLFYQMLEVARHTKNYFGRFLCMGIMLHLAFQTLVNIGVATSAIPNTGVTLPFFSSGGSALLICFAQIGVVLSVYRHGSVEYKKLK